MIFACSAKAISQAGMISKFMSGLAFQENALQNIVAQSPYELLDRHVGFSICRMEGDFLSRGFADEQDAFVFRRAPAHDRNQLQFSSYSEREDDRRLVEGDAGEFQVQSESAAESDALAEAAKLR